MAEVEGLKAVSLVFRIAVLGLSVAAAVVMVTASQFGHGGVVSYSKYSALVYFVVANVISAVCSALALYLSVVYKATSSPVSLLDVLTQGLLFSAAAAVFALRGVATWSWRAKDGADAAGPPWGISVCDVAGEFCAKVSTAATICACAAVAVSIAVLTKDARGSVPINSGAGGGSGGSCKHGGHSSHC